MSIALSGRHGPQLLEEVIVVPDPEELRAARLSQSQGLSQNEVAARIGVSQLTITNWENGKGGPRATHLARLRDFLPLDEIAADARSSEVSNPPLDDGHLPSQVTGPFGAWLRNTRMARGWTQVELSRKSGVSDSHIANMEAGRWSNPRPDTRKRLEEAFGEAEPQDVQEEVKRETEVPGLGWGSLEDFDPYDDADIPREPEVYGCATGM